MRKEKNTNVKHVPEMKVVESPNDQAHIEIEIDRQVKSIRALIQRLRPVERQRYYEGFLSHLLSQPVSYPDTANHGNNNNNNIDFSNLSITDLTLIQELSVKMEELYRISENDHMS